MSSSFIQIKPMGMLPFYHNSRTLISSPEYPQQQARERASRNLFGSPERGAINQMYRQEEKQRCQQFQQRYSLLMDDLDEIPLIPKKQPTPTIKPRPTIPTNTTTIVVFSNATTKQKNLTAECRLSGGGSESLIEKELREYEMKLKQQQQRKKNCNEKLAAGDRIKSRSNLKLDENNAAATVTRTTFVDSSKCANGNGSGGGGHGERPKPYARQMQSSMTDYYAQRKTVVCNNNRTASEIPSIEVEATQVLSHLLDDQSVEVESSANTKTTSESLSSSLCSSPSLLSSATSILPCTEESSSQEHYTTRVTTDVVSAEQLA